MPRRGCPAPRVIARYNRRTRITRVHRSPISALAQTCFSSGAQPDFPHFRRWGRKSPRRGLAIQRGFRRCRRSAGTSINPALSWARRSAGPTGRRMTAVGAARRLRPHGSFGLRHRKDSTTEKRRRATEGHGSRSGRVDRGSATSLPVRSPAMTNRCDSCGPPWPSVVSPW